MKMTDVITKLREVNPVVQQKSVDLGVGLSKVVDLVKDADRCNSEEGRKAIIAKLVVEALGTKLLYDDMERGLSELDAVTQSYTRVFESSAQKAPAKDDNQPDLPGLSHDETERNEAEGAVLEPSAGASEQ